MSPEPPASVPACTHAYLAPGRELWRDLLFNARPILRGPILVGNVRTSCGATARRGRPLGGGTGYTETIRPTGSPISHLDELIEALAGARSGDTIYVAGDAVIECTERIHVEELMLLTH